MSARRRISVALAAVLVAGACSSDPGARIFTSPDGLLTVEIPAGVEVAQPITIEALDATELPSELRSLELRGAVHELGPDGMTFARPVTIKRYLDPEALGFDPAKEIRQVTLASRSSRGDWSVLEDQRLSVEGERGVITATTTHFSSVAAFAGAIVYTLEPSDVVRQVGEGWRACVSQRRLADVEGDTEYEDVRALPGTGGIVRSTGGGHDCVLGDGTIVAGRPQAGFTCSARGSDSFAVLVKVSELTPKYFEDLLGIKLDKVSQDVLLGGRATCRGGSASPEPKGAVTIATGPLTAEEKQQGATRIESLVVDATTPGAVRITVPKQWTPERGAGAKAAFALIGEVVAPDGRATTLDCAAFGTRRSCMVYPSDDPGKSVATAPLAAVSMEPGEDWSMTVPLVGEGGRSVALLGDDRFTVSITQLTISGARSPLLVANLDASGFDAALWD
jgi:hypothetical protein